MKAAHGCVFKYGDNVDTDVIIPARYLNSSDPKELATHCMEDIDKDFVNNVKAGDIMVANKNFGCGSSREHAPIAIKAAGVSCVIAETFARIFYRNAINIGLPIIECPEAAKAINAGDEVTVDFDSGIITDETTGEKFKGQAFPPFMQKIIDCEGLVNYINPRGYITAGVFSTILKVMVICELWDMCSINQIAADTAHIYRKLSQKCKYPRIPCLIYFRYSFRDSFFLCHVHEPYRQLYCRQ